MINYQIENNWREFVVILITLVAYAMNETLRDALPETWARLVSFGVIYGLLFLLYDRIIWKFLKCIHGVPYLEGSYAGIIRRTDKLEDTPITVQIRQTWSKLSFTLESKNKTSNIRTCKIAPDESAHTVLTAVYYSSKKGTANLDTAHSIGTQTLQILDDGSINGDFFSTTGRQGSLKLTKK